MPVLGLQGPVFAAASLSVCFLNKHKVVRNNVWNPVLDQYKCRVHIFVLQATPVIDAVLQKNAPVIKVHPPCPFVHVQPVLRRPKCSRASREDRGVVLHVRDDDRVAGAQLQHALLRLSYCRFKLVGSSLARAGSILAGVAKSSPAVLP